MGKFFSRSPYDPEWVTQLLMQGPYAPAGTMRRTAPPMSPMAPAPPPPAPPSLPIPAFEPPTASSLAPTPLPGQKIPGLRHYDKPLHLRFGGQKLEVDSLADLPEMTEEQVRMIDSQLCSDLFGSAQASLVPAWIAIEKGMKDEAMAKMNSTQSANRRLLEGNRQGVLKSASTYEPRRDRETNTSRSTILKYSSDFDVETEIPEVESAVKSASNQILRKLSRVETARSEFHETRGVEKTPSGEAIRMGEKLIEITGQPTISMAFSRAVNLMRRANRKLTSKSTRAEKGSCRGRHDNACAEIGGSTIRFPPKFFRMPAPKRTSVMVHEAFHLAGADDPEAENFECFISPEFCKVASFTKSY